MRLVADLDAVTVPDGRWRDALLAAAGDLVSGEIPAVAYDTDSAGDPLRYLYDQGVALRRVAGVLGYAFAATKDRCYLRAMAAHVALNAARWPDWNPGHPLDTAQVATAVALAYGWSRAELAPVERREVVHALRDRVLVPYVRDDGALARFRTAAGNQSTVVATAAVLAGLAVRADDADAAGAAVADGAAALARFRRPDDEGRSLAGGPTVEGLMYTAYEAAHLALLHTTCWTNAGDAALSELEGSIADLGQLAEWSERCGTVAEPAMGDAWDVYPWVDRTTALAAMTAWPAAGPRVHGLLDGLQARAALTVPGWGSRPVPDGIAELVLAAHPAGPAAPPPPAPAFVPRDGTGGSFWGCAAHGDLRAYVSATPNDAPHAHRDVGNVVVLHGEQPVLTDLGQRDYGFSARHVWRASTRVHSTVGVLRDDGRVRQARAGRGSVTAARNGLRMTSSSAVPGVDWSRDVVVEDGAVRLRDRLRPRRAPDPRRLSMSFLLAAPADRVEDLGDRRLRFALGDGSVWDLTVPGDTSPVVSDARPTPPYEDTAAFAAGAAGSHTLVVVTLPALDDAAGLDLATTVLRVATT